MQTTVASHLQRHSETSSLPHCFKVLMTSTRKRTTTETSNNEEGDPGKRPRVDKSHLNSWLKAPSLQVPQLIASSAEIVDQDSVFLAHAASIASAAQAEVFRRHVREQHAADEASHEMLAWRCLVPKAGKDGSESEADWMLKTSFDDDGERWGGERILKVLERESAVDVAVVCSRWFGGTMIGKARFNHIEACTKSALAQLNRLERESQVLKQLRELDDTIHTLCQTLTDEGQPASPGKPMDYAAANLEKLDRLVAARHKRVAHLKAQLEKLRES